MERFTARRFAPDRFTGILLGLSLIIIGMLSIQVYTYNPQEDLLTEQILDFLMDKAIDGLGPLGR